MITLKEQTHTQEIEIMTTLNNNEQKVIRTIADISYDDYGTSLEEIVERTGLTANQVKGYISALNKKMLVDIGDADDHSTSCDVYFIWDTKEIEIPSAFGCDQMERDEYDRNVEKLIESA